MSTPLPSNALSRRGFIAVVSASLASAGMPVRAPLGAAPDADLIGEPSFYLTRGGETLLDIALERDLGVPEISALNPGVDPWVPGAETLISLPTQFILPDAPRRGIVVNYGDLRLYHFRKDGSIVTHAIGVGREGFEIKLGQTKIVRKQERPTWYPTASTRRDRPELDAVVPPGPDNPLGEYALYLGWPTYLIHGTNKPYGVGRRVSRGCIRMYPHAVRRLFAEVPIGTPVTAVNQTVKAGWHRGELYIEAQPDFAQIDELEATHGISPRPPTGEERQVILERAGSEAARIDWTLAEAELLKRRGIPVQITRPWSAVSTTAPAATPSAATAGAARSVPEAGGIY